MLLSVTYIFLHGAGVTSLLCKFPVKAKLQERQQNHCILKILNVKHPSTMFIVEAIVGGNGYLHFGFAII